MASLIRSAIRELKNTVLEYDPIEISVREATSNEPSSASYTSMMECANATYSYENYPKMFNMLWKRITDYSQIRHVQKALFLIEFLLKHGNERFISDVRQRSDDISKLRAYKYIEEDRDIAGDVRKKAAAVFAFLMDDARLKEERDQAKLTHSYVPKSQHGINNSTSTRKPVSSAKPKIVIKPKVEEEEEEVEVKPKKKSTKKVESEEDEPVKVKKDDKKKKSEPVVEEKPKKKAPKKEVEEDDDFDFAHTAPVVVKDPSRNRATSTIPAPTASSNLSRGRSATESANKKPEVYDEFDFLSNPNMNSSKKPKVIAEDEIDFLSDQVSSSNNNSNSNQDWASAFTIPMSATANVTNAKIVNTKKDVVGTFTFDAEVESTPDDLWNKHSNLIVDNKKNAKSVAPVKAKTIRELQQEQSGDYFDTIAKSPVKPNSNPAPQQQQVVPETIGYDAYGLPILASSSNSFGVAPPKQQQQLPQKSVQNFYGNNNMQPGYGINSQPGYGINNNYAAANNNMFAMQQNNNAKKNNSAPDPFANITWK